jgi:hypothetical protein
VAAQPSPAAAAAVIRTFAKSYLFSPSQICMRGPFSNVYPQKTWLCKKKAAKIVL